MHRFVLLLALLAIQEASASSKVLYFGERVENFLKRKCTNYTTQKEASDQLRMFITYWRIPVPEKTAKSGEQYKKCIQDSQDFIVHFEEFAESLRPCLQEKEQYLPKFLVDSYGYYNHHQCIFFTATGEILANMHKCQKKFLENPSIAPIIACFRNSTILGDRSKTTVVTKDEVCKDLKNVRDCYEEVTEEQCPDSPELKNIGIVPIQKALTYC